MDDIFAPPRPSTAALRQIAPDSIAQCDRLLRESLDHATWLETELARERRRLVDLRNRRAEWARILKD